MVSPHTCRVVQLVRAYVNVEVSNQLFEYVSLVSTRGLKNKEKDLVSEYPRYWLPVSVRPSGLFTYVD
jgi:hypothetical protein